MRRSWIAAFSVFLLAALFVPEARAEVAAETDAFGRYIRTSIFTQSSLRSVKIWRTVRRNMSGVHPLNPAGDRLGDLYPFVAENPRDGRLPVAVWSRFNGMDYDLVWSRWQAGHWTPVDWVSPGVEGDDVQPFVTFDATGRPYVAWWRDENGIGKVYVSFFLATRWSDPILISDLGVDSRSPRINSLGGTQMRVDYQTGAMIESRILTYNGPTTITDDICPGNQVSVTRTMTQRSTWP